MTIKKLLVCGFTLMAHSAWAGVAISNIQLGTDRVAPEGDFAVRATVQSDQRERSASVCYEFTNNNQFQFGACQKNIYLRANSPKNIEFQVRAPRAANSYQLHIVVMRDADWSMLGKVSNTSYLVVGNAASPQPAPSPSPVIVGFPVMRDSFLGIQLSPTSVAKGGSFSISGNVTSPQNVNGASVCYGFTAANDHQFGSCKDVGSLTSGQALAVQFSGVVPNEAEIVQSGSGYKLDIAIYQNNPWALISRIRSDLTLTIGSSSSTPVVSAPVQPPSPAPAQSAGLLFSDEFDRLDIASSSNPNGFWRPNDFWQNISEGYTDFAGTSFNINPNDPAFAGYSPFSVQNGILTIKAVRTPDAIKAAIQRTTGGAVPAWSGGMLIQNANLRRWRYGYMEIRARFPIQGKGMFPALWLFNSDPNNPAKGGAEMDLLEIFGVPNYFFSGVHLRNNQQVGRGLSLYEGSVDAGGWHTYAVDWQPTYYRIYVDGVLKTNLTGADAQYFDTTMGIRLNYAMDAPWFGTNASDASTPSVLTMEVDYVRVYGQKP